MFSVYDFFVSFILAFIVAFSATPIAKRIAFKTGAVDIPKDDRRMHKKPIARFGGLAIVSGFVISVLFIVLGAFLGITNAFTPDLRLLGVLIGIVFIEIEGIFDDIKPISPKFKMTFQSLAALAVITTGTRIEVITNPFSSSGIAVLSPYISYPLTFLWIVGITNAINFIDGLDGLAAGVSSIASLSLFFVSVITGEMYTAMITVILAGSILGFLPYNFNPAKIFMGETGSAFLGFILGVVSIQGMVKSYAAIAIAIPILVLGLPLFDTIFAIIRRLAKGMSPAKADRGHLHHRLIDMGLSQKQSVVVMYTVSAALGLCAIVLADKGALSAIILVIAVSVFVIGGARYMSEIGDAETADSHTNEEQPAEKDTANIVNSDVKDA